MSHPGIDAAAWRDQLGQLTAPGIRHLLLVQCSLQWLRPEASELRDEIDAALLDAYARRPGLKVDRLVLHNLPVLGGAALGDLRELTAAHRAWMYRLAVTALLIPQPDRLRIHRLIVRGEDIAAGIGDAIDVQRGGAWGRPRQTSPILELVATGRRTTPLTGYDVDLDGPFGDTDPSVYI